MRTIYLEGKLYKNSIVVTILFIFVIVFFLFIHMIYLDKTNDIKYIKTNMESKVNNLYDDISNVMKKKELQGIMNFLTQGYKEEEKLQAVKDKDREKLIKFFEVHYKNLKKNMPGFEIMHIFDKNGVSILRMHDKNKYGDNLTVFRDCIKNLIINPATCAFFEVGIQGLAYRHIKPLYYKDQLIGFFELGVKPVVLIEKLKNVFNVKSYILIQKEFIPDGMKISPDPLSYNGFQLCETCSKKDQFIENNIEKINFNHGSNEEIIYQDKHYSVIKKNIYNAQNRPIGVILLFQDISLLSTQLKNLMTELIILLLITSLIVYLTLRKYINLIYKKLTKARFLLDNTNDAVYVVSLKDGSLLDINNRAIDMLYYSKQELLKMRVSDFRSPMEGDKELNWIEHVNKLKEKKFITSRGIHQRKDGTTFPVESNLSYVQDAEDEYMIAVARDITHQLELENKINNRANELQRLQTIISKSVLYTTSDLDGNITSVSKAFEKLTGYTKDELIGKNYSFFKTEETGEEFYQNMWETLENNEQFIGEIKNKDKNNKTYWVKLTIDPIFNDKGEKVGYSSYKENITDKKELEYLSNHDPLTGLYNRGYFQREITKKIKSADRYDQNFGLIMFDVDYFKQVNDTHGHDIGDNVLKVLSHAVLESIREDDILARWGGEEFIVIANGAYKEELIGLVEKLQSKIKKLSFKKVKQITVSFGITVYKEGESEESIQKRADKALYLAKNNGRDRYEVL